jgi:methionyl-tRNA formyltransferase
VLTGDGVLRLHRVRVESGPQVSAAQVVRSVRSTLGLRTADLVRELAQLRAELSAGRHVPDGLQGTPVPPAAVPPSDSCGDA